MEAQSLNHWSAKEVSATSEYNDNDFLNSFFSIYSYEVYQCLKKNKRDFAGGPVVKTSPSNAGGAVLSLVGELRTHMPCRQKPKT